MKRARHAPRPVTQLGEPFASAVDGWFWCVSCLKAREDGARFVSGAGLTPRPCEPDDLIRSVENQHRMGRLTRHHLRVLSDYGRQIVAPDPRNRDEERAARLWDEAFDLLTPIWRRKGIVE